MPKGRVRRRQRKRPSQRFRPILAPLLTRRFAGILLFLLVSGTVVTTLIPLEPLSSQWHGIVWASFGWMSPVALLALLAAGLLLALPPPTHRSKPWPWRPITSIGLAWWILMGLLSLVSPQAGSGGGLMGMALGLPLSQLVGPVLAFAALLLMGLAVLFWGFSIPPRRLAEGYRTLENQVKALPRRRDPTIRRETPVPVRGGHPALSRPMEMGHEAGETVEGLPGTGPSLAVEEAPASSLSPKSATESGELAMPLRRTEEGLEWQVPPIELLESPTSLEPNEREIRKKAQLIEETLAHFGVPARVTEISQGPAVTQFGVEPGFDVKTKEVKDKERRVVRVEEVSRTKVKVARITSLSNDLALSLSAQSIRIQAPVPGRSVVGIEVPNTSISLVGLRGVVESPPFQRLSARSKLALALGRGVDGEAIVGDLGKMPHLLIAGATGSGKSVCLNSIIACLLMHTTPDEVRLLIIDPKRVEMASFRGIPHLWAPIVVEVEEVVRVLKMVTHEMDERYKRFAHAGARNIDGYNKRPLDKPLPFLVVIVDELADLMMVAPEEVERTICRLAQLARATGIHLVVATQRPSVDVVTGLIKANFPTRISFAVTSQVDSRTILDMGGAEKLLGRGDMLYMSSDASRPVRLQGSYVSDSELDRIVRFWKGIKGPQYIWERNQIANWSEEARAGEDPLLEAARRMAQENVRLSTSLLQRRLHIGYPRAARLMELLEEEGMSPTAEGRSRLGQDFESY